MPLKDKFKNPMVENFISLVLLQGINYLLPLISVPFLVRVLEIERWGLVSIGLGLTQYFIIFTDFGFNLSATKYISEKRNDKDLVNAYLNSAMIGRVFLCLVSFFILLLLIFFFNKFKTEAVFYLLFFGMVIGNVMFPMWFFQGMEKMKYMTVFHISAKLLTFSPLFFVIKGPEDYIYVPLFYAIGYISAGLISLYFVYKTLGMKWFIPTFKEIKEALTSSATYFLSRASTSLFTTSNSFILGLVLGNTAAGYYSAAEKFYQAYNQLLGPFIGVLFPHIANTRNVKFFKNTFKRITISNVFLLTAVIVCSKFIITLAYGNTENEILANGNIEDGTLTVFRILLIGCYVTIPSMLLGYPFLAAMGHPHYTNWTTITTSIVHITGLLLLILTNQLSIYSVAIMVVISESLLCFLRVRGVMKYKLMKEP